MFIKLAANETDAFGRTVYAELIRKHTTGMPPIHGMPPETAGLKLTDPRLADKLPSGYGAAFGKKAFGLAYRVFGRPDMVDDFLSKFLIFFLTKFAHEIKEGGTLSEAESFVLAKVAWMAKDELKSVRRRRDKVVVDEPDDESVEVQDFADPNKFKRLEHELSRDQLKAIFEYLAKHVHPDVQKYLELSAEGYSDEEIINEKMLPHYDKGIANWNSNYKRHILPAVTEFLRKQEYVRHKKL